MNTIFYLKSITKKYQLLSNKYTLALDNIDLKIKEGEFITIVGPSGCGKTTLLKILSGIETKSSGEILFHNPMPKLGFVFQSNTIFPWRTVEQNLTYSLELRGLSKIKRHNEAIRLSRLIGFDPESILDKYPKELSGGETRRVALGMALAYDASVFLLDEPTSQLDFYTKDQIHEVVQNLWLKYSHFTFLFVTHDIDEAILLGNRVLIINSGKILNSLDINFSYPRKQSLLSEPVFHNYRSTIRNYYEQS